MLSKMCDLFALSAGKDYSAPKSLPLFAKQASKNLDGWGIGYFKKHRALVEKSAEGAYVAGRVHDSFQRLARVVKSRIILCHVRLRTSGPVDECNAHPFVPLCFHSLVMIGSSFTMARRRRLKATKPAQIQ
jgi:predicted glutamine amidotransferase